jgi:hypothetical protein
MIVFKADQSIATFPQYRDTKTTGLNPVPSVTSGEPSADSADTMNKTPAEWEAYRSMWRARLFEASNRQYELGEALLDKGNRLLAAGGHDHDACRLIQAGIRMMKDSLQRARTELRKAT